MQGRCRPVGPAAHQQRSPRDSNSDRLRTGEVCRPEHLETFCESSRQDSNLRYPACKAGVLAARRRDDGSRRGGTRTHRHQAPGTARRVVVAALPICLPGDDDELRVWVSNPALRVYETRPSTGPPAIERYQAPVSSPASRPHESRPGACHAWGLSTVAEGRLEFPRRCGHERLRLARLPPPPPGHEAKQPVRESNPPLLAENQGSLPIDERAMNVPVRRDGVEPPGPEGTWSTATRARQCPADAFIRGPVARVGIEPTGTEV